MADFGGIPMMGMPMPMPGGMPPMGGMTGDMLSYVPGWFYGSTVANSSSNYSAMRDRMTLTGIVPLEYSYNTSDPKYLKAKSQIVKKLYETKNLLRLHTIEVRKNFAMALVLDSISSLEDTYGDLPFSKSMIDTIDPREIQRRVTETLSSELTNKKNEDTKNNSLEFNPVLKLAFSDEFYDKEDELKFIKSFIKKTVAKRKNNNWRRDTARKISTDYKHYMSCLTVYGYHNYNVYNWLLGNEQKNMMFKDQFNENMMLPDVNDQVDLKNYLDFEYEYEFSDAFFKKQEEYNKERAFMNDCFSQYMQIKTQFYKGHKLSEFNENVKNLSKQLKDHRFAFLNKEITNILGSYNSLLKDCDVLAREGYLVSSKDFKLEDYKNSYVGFKDSFNSILELAKKNDKLGSMDNTVELEQLFHNIEDNIHKLLPYFDAAKNTKTNAQPVPVSTEAAVQPQVEEETEILEPQENTNDNYMNLNDFLNGQADSSRNSYDSLVKPVKAKNEILEPSVVEPIRKKSSSSVQMEEEFDFWNDLVEDYIKTSQTPSIQNIATVDRKEDTYNKKDTRSSDEELIEMLSNIDDEEVDFTSGKGIRR